MRATLFFALANGMILVHYDKNNGIGNFEG